MQVAPLYVPSSFSLLLKNLEFGVFVFLLVAVVVVVLVSVTAAVVAVVVTVVFVGVEFAAKQLSDSQIFSIPVIYPLAIIDYYLDLFRDYEYRLPSLKLT